MDSLLHGMLKQNLGDTTLWPQLSDSVGEKKDGIPRPHLLEVEPVRVIDKESKMLSVYPSRVDLIFDDINVVRDG